MEILIEASKVAWIVILFLYFSTSWVFVVGGEEGDPVPLWLLPGVTTVKLLATLLSGVIIFGLIGLLFAVPLYYFFK